MGATRHVVLAAFWSSAARAAAEAERNGLQRLLGEIPGPQLLWLGGVIVLVLMGVARFRNAR